jgi:hypothetical protein
MREKWKVKCTLIGLPLDNFKNEKRCEYQRRYRLTRSGFFLGGWQVKSATSFWNLRVSTRSFFSQNVKWPDIYPKYLVLGTVLGQTASMFSQNYLADLPLLDLFSQGLLANLLQIGLRLNCQKSASMCSHNLLAESPQVGLRVICLKSASVSSQCHLAEVPQFGLRLPTATSFSHVSTSQLADMLQNEPRLNFQILRVRTRSILSHVLLHLLLRLDI